MPMIADKHSSQISESIVSCAEKSYSLTQIHGEIHEHSIQIVKRTIFAPSTSNYDDDATDSCKPTQKQWDRSQTFTQFNLYPMTNPWASFSILKSAIQPSWPWRHPLVTHQPRIMTKMHTDAFKESEKASKTITPLKMKKKETKRFHCQQTRPRGSSDDRTAAHAIAQAAAARSAENMLATPPR